MSDYSRDIKQHFREAGCCFERHALCSMFYALGTLAKGRKAKESGDSYQLRETSVPYGEYFGGYPVQPFLFCLTGVINEDIGLKNTYFWNFNPEESSR